MEGSCVISQLRDLRLLQFLGPHHYPGKVSMFYTCRKVTS